MRFHHIGIPTAIRREGETYMERLDLHCTDHESNPFGIQWMRYGEKCPLPEIVKSTAHPAFQVDDLEAALRGMEVIIPPSSPSEGVVVAFILVDGAPVELLEYRQDTGGAKMNRPEPGGVPGKA
jgi:hypothetical protein